MLPILLAASGASAQEEEAKTAPRAIELLKAIASADSGKERLERAEELVALEPTPVDALEEFLGRERSSTDAERRRVLGAIDAEVPNKKGRFPSQNRRLSEKEKKAMEQRDWLAELAEQGRDLPALGEVFADVAAIRALADARSPEAAKVILDFAFTEIGLVYRDECGRRLRHMSPVSLPALIRGSENRKHAYSLRRYAGYQLERLDRENPHKAMQDADTDELKIAILDAFADSRYREAIYAVLEYVDHTAPAVREAAREAWLQYAESQPYRVPKRKLELPGGKKTDEREKLWLNHKELQTIALRRKLEELTGEEPEKGAGLIEMSEELFAFYDEQRAQELEEQFEEALALSEEGDAKKAAKMMDAILVQAPDFHRKEEMVPVYLAYGESLEQEESWEEAAIAYGKAHAMAPEGPQASKALGKHHFARGKALEAEGGDASAEFARALEVDPDHDQLSAGAGDSKWMLYAGIGGGAGGLLLLVLGLVFRRRSS